MSALQLVVDVSEDEREMTVGAIADDRESAEAAGTWLASTMISRSRDDWRLLSARTRVMTDTGQTAWRGEFTR